MVYKKVFVVAGYVIDREEADEEEYVDADGYVDDQYSDIVHFWPCCSKLQGKKYILGRIVHTYYRKPLKGCGIDLGHGDEKGDTQVDSDTIISDFDVCGKYYRCSKCLGTCAGGAKKDTWFDVDKILDDIVEVDASEVCPVCFSVDGIHIGDICKLCFHKKKYNLQYENSKIPNGTGKSKIRYYLLLDDCLSCS